MCTITTQNKSIKTDKSIDCFKIVNRYVQDGKASFLSGFQMYPCKINELDKAKITFDKKHETKFVVLDDMERNTFYSGDVVDFIGYEVKPEYVGKLKSVVCGFHSSTIENRLVGLVCRGQVIVKCVIPKGSLVYYGSDGLIVSNKIIVTDEIV